MRILALSPFNFSLCIAHDLSFEPNAGQGASGALEVTPDSVATLTPARFNFTSGTNVNQFNLRGTSSRTAVLRVTAEGYGDSASYAIRVGN